MKDERVPAINSQNENCCSISAKGEGKMRNLPHKIVLLLIGITAQAALAGQITIESRLANGLWKTGFAVEPLKGQPILLCVKQIRDASIRWFQIVPDIDTQYNNAVWPWLPDAYKWKGYADIKYDRIHLEQYDNKWEIELFYQRSPPAKPPFSTNGDSFLAAIKGFFFGSADSTSQNVSVSSFKNPTLGTFWYQVEVVKNNQRYQTPGIESKDERGLSPKVFRVSVKQGNDFLGNLTSYFNVPAVFGSTPYQVRNYIGVDCADVLMAAYSKWKNLPITKDYNVAMLASKFPARVKATVRGGRPDSNIHWVKDVQEGDLIAVKYQGSRQYQHIGALYEDQNRNGLLDDCDMIIHAGPDPLHFSELRSGKFDGSVVILRPN